MSVDSEPARIPSYERINYALRPAKAIERRMLCEVFSRLYPFQPVDQYGYVGLGSIYFADFQLVHRLLGIADLYSMEQDSINEERFRLNLPFGCIDIDFAHSGALLPSIDWTRKRIIWLDYDGALGPAELADVATVVTMAKSGSFLAISINAHAINEPKDQEVKAIERRTAKPFKLADYRLMKFHLQLGDKVPVGTEGKALKMEGLPKVLRKIILNEVQAQLAVRNELLSPEEKLKFFQVINFVYKDGAQMVTIGGVLVAAKDHDSFIKCRFSELPYVKTEEDSFAIRVPCLTPDEMRHLDSFLPTNNISTIARRGIPEEDVLKYLNVYRYFPNYAELLLS